MEEQDLVDRVRALAPMVAAHARQAEEERKPVDSVMQAIEGAGVYRFFVPKRYGGYEFSLAAFMDIGMILGEACISTGWVTTFCMEHNWLLALYNQQAQDEIFGKQPYIIAPGALSPKGTATPVEGGYRVSGRWEWGTGVMHSDWVMVGALTRSAASEQPDLYMFLIPRQQAEIIDTWHTAGMIGTGSNDIAVNDVFVPGHLAQNIGDMRDGRSPGAEVNDSYLYRMPMLPVLGLTAAAPVVGGARKAVAIFQERLQERYVYGTATKQGDKPVAQIRLGLLKARAESLEAKLEATALEVEAWGKCGVPCPAIERAKLRVQIGSIVRESRDIVRDVVEASGAHAHFLDNPLQRIQRDVHTASCHTVFDLDVSAEQYGRLLLGLEPNAPF
ncbi:MAG TPA: acyl-CoA dehydrogenase family protein [Pseudomonadales bacterium]